MAETSRPEAEAKAGPDSQPRLYRSRKDRVIAGIGGGLGDYFGFDPVWFRIGFVVLTLTGGSGVLIYLVLWLVVPEAPEGYEPPERPAAASMPAAALIGAVLIAMGGVALLNSVIPQAGRFLWPLALVVVGLILVLGGLNRGRSE
ncbi:MAG: PspC domain-containing protein [Acidimicrobiia bacterium]